MRNAIPGRSETEGVVLEPVASPGSSAPPGADRRQLRLPSREVHALVGERLGQVDPPRDREGSWTPIWARSGSGPNPPSGLSGGGPPSDWPWRIRTRPRSWPSPSRTTSICGSAGPTTSVPAEETMGTGSSGSSTSTSSRSPTHRRPSRCRAAALRGGQGARHRSQGAPARRANHGPGAQRGRSPAPTVAACRERGVGVVYVSHRLPEVLEIADRITVLRDGRIRGTFDASATNESARWSS